MSPHQVISLLEFMERYDIGRLYQSVGVLNGPWATVPPEGELAIPYDNFEDLKRAAEFVVAELSRLDAPISFDKAKQFHALYIAEAAYFKHPTKTDKWVKFSWRAVGRLRELAKSLSSFVNEEMRLKKMVIVSGKYGQILDEPEAGFGPDVQSKFRSATYDIAEAARCLALGRSTASVFHAMRVAEIGIQAMCRCLGIPDPIKPAERNWGKRLEAVEAAMKARWPLSADRMHGDGEWFERIHSFLVAIQNPWRNATAHPDAKYTEDEADAIFRYTADLMKRIASRMDEFGEPKA